MIGLCVIQDGIPYDPIHGQGHRGQKVAKMADFKVLSPLPIRMQSKD